MTEEGGGVRTYQGDTLTNTNSTLSGNSAGWGGAAISTNSLIDGNCVDSGGDLASGGYNIESPGDTCSFTSTGDQTSVGASSLRLGPLLDNGGPTETHALLSGSPAINAIPQGVCGVNEDQRGVASGSRVRRRRV